LKNENSSLAEQNEALKKQNEENAKNLASSLVDNALNTGKIANSQKEWAMSYACKDLEGFKSFLDTKDTQAQTQVPKNNVFANKNNSASNSGLDVVKLMLGA
ncbi:phage protease, partial [Campylobacter jejuni]